MTSQKLSYEEYQNRGYAPELDGLRAVAVLLVISAHVAGHAFDFLVGHLGVTVFFVLSGYLITTLALREESTRGHLHLGAFFVRRTFRIFPLYYFTLALYAVFLLGTDRKPAQTEFFLSHLPHYVFYFPEVAAADVRFLGGDMPFLQSWSLGIEEKFYIIWPAIGFVVLAGLPRLRFISACVMLATVYFLPIYLDDVGRTAVAFCLRPYGEILVGVLLAITLHSQAGYAAFLRVRKLLPTPIILLVWLVAHISTPQMIGADLGATWRLLYAFASALMLGALVTSSGRFRQVLSWGPLTSVGRVSYAVYLLHILPLMIGHALAAKMPVEVLRPYVALVVAIIGSYLIAMVTAVVLERPMIRIGRRLSNRLMNPTPIPAQAPAALSAPPSTRLQAVVR